MQEHIASRAKGVEERIASVTSLRADVDGYYDISFLTNARPLTKIDDLYREWAEYRLNVMKKETEGTLRKVQANKISPEDFHIFGKRQVEYMQQTYRQMVPEVLLQKTLEKRGKPAYWNVHYEWDRLRQVAGFD